MSALLRCKALDNTNIVAIDSATSRLEQARKYGITKLIKAGNIGIKEKVFKMFPQGVDFCVDFFIRILRE